MEVIDTRGLKSPKPLVMLKQAINDLSMPEQFLIIVDNLSSKDEIEDYLKENQISYNARGEENVFRITINKNNLDSSKLSDDETEEDYLIAFGNNQLGRGNEDLGKELINEFVNTLKKEKNLPSKIIFYNAGVFLITGNSSIIEVFKEFEQAGIELLICERSVNCFNLKNQISIGSIISMVQISNYIIASKKVLII